MATKKRVLDDANDDKTAPETWITQTRKRLKEHNVPEVEKMLLDQLPMTAERKERLENGLMNMLLDESKRVTEKEFGQFRANIEKHVQENVIEFVVFDVGGTTKESIIRNCAWISKNTWGCSFGREVGCSWCAEPPPMEELKCLTLEDLHRLQQKYSGQSSWSDFTVGSFMSLEDAIMNVVSQDGEGPQMIEIYDEIHRLRKYMEDANCRCVQAFPVP